MSISAQMLAVVWVSSTIVTSGLSRFKPQLNVVLFYSELIYAIDEGITLTTCITGILELNFKELRDVITVFDQSDSTTTIIDRQFVNVVQHPRAIKQLWNCKGIAFCEYFECIGSGHDRPYWVQIHSCNIDLRINALRHKSLQTTKGDPKASSDYYTHSCNQVITIFLLNTSGTVTLVGSSTTISAWLKAP
ncbi:hypothetical protein D3C75_943590 [compost metagenome]